MDPKDKRNKKNVIAGNDVDKSIPESAYLIFDTDLARDNLENDLPAADLEDL
ncbi:MAG: hypothetical protein AB7E30_06640 [Lawsonibacter sp.]